MDFVVAISRNGSPHMGWTSSNGLAFRKEYVNSFEKRHRSYHYRETSFCGSRLLDSPSPT